MRVYVDLITQKIVLGAGQAQEIAELRFVRTPTATIEVQFVRDGVVQELASDATGIIEFKTRLRFDDPPITGSDSWTKSGSATTTVYSWTVPLSAGAIDTAFKVDGDASNDVEFLELMVGIQWTEGGRVNETFKVNSKLFNDVVREGDVLSVMPPYTHSVFPEGISSIANLKAIPTVDAVLGYLIEILIVVGGQLSYLTYRLSAGPAVNPEPGDVEPNDYDAMDNDKHWEGAVGPSGPAGRDSGLSYKWNTNTSVSDPGAGKLKVSSGTLSAATALWISETDDDANVLSALILSWGNGSSATKGTLVIQDSTTPTNFAVFRITSAATDNGAWDVYTIAHVVSGGTLTNNLPVKLSFYPTGDIGSTGRDGGFKYLFNTTTTPANPGSGKLQFNSTTFASITQLDIHETDADSNGLAAFLATLDDSTSTFKTLMIVTKQNGTAIKSFFITGTITDNGAWDTFTVTPIGTSGSIANNDVVFLHFYRVGDKGLTGDTGATGPEAAIHYLWNTNTSISDPTSGHLKVDGTLTAATTLSIDETDNDGNALALWLATLDDSTSTIKGTLFIHSPTTPIKFVHYRISGVRTDNGTWDQFTIAHVAHGSNFSNNDPVSIVFVPSGDAGSAGAPGGTTYDAAASIGAGTTGVDIDLTAASMTEPRLLTANTDFDLINPVNGKVTIIHIKQAAASAFTVTFNGTIKWMGTGGVQPAQSTGFNVIDTWTAWYDGINLYMSWSPGE